MPQTDRHALAASLIPTLTLAGVGLTVVSGQYPLEQCRCHKSRQVRTLPSQPFCCSPLDAPELFPRCCSPCGSPGGRERCEMGVQPRGSARAAGAAARSGLGPLPMLTTAVHVPKCVTSELNPCTAARRLFRDHPRMWEGSGTVRKVRLLNCTWKWPKFQELLTEVCAAVPHGQLWVNY